MRLSLIKWPSIGGSPTTIFANNGTTLIGGNTVQLGQDVDAAGDPGKLISNRQLVLNDNTLSIKQDIYGSSILFEAFKVSIITDNTNGGNSLTFSEVSSPGQDFIVSQVGTAIGGDLAGVIFYGTSSITVHNNGNIVIDASTGTIIQGTGLTFSDNVIPIALASTGILVYQLTGTDIALINAPHLNITGSLKTAVPPSGVTTASNWYLGSVQNAAVILDTTRYVEVNINGAIVKLAIVN